MLHEEVEKFSRLSGEGGMKDIIYREDAIRMVHEEFDEVLVLDESGEYIAYKVESVLDLVPSVGSEPKKGEWINKDFYGVGEGSAECSVCHKRSSGYQEDDGWSVHCLFYDFCPNCGVRMVVK